MTAAATSLATARDAADERRAGVLFALGCFGIWGFAALYFRQRLASGAMGPQELLATLVEVFNMQQRGHDVTRLVP